MIKIQKKYQFLGGIIIVIILAIILQIITPKKVIPPTEILPTATPTSIITPTKYTEPSANWNSQILNDLKQYKKTDKSRVDQALSSVRLKSPITQPNFTVEYSYHTATYTFILKEPVENSKQEALLWLKNLGISEKDLQLIQVDWVTAP